MKYGFIGCGNMAGAILEGSVKARAIMPQDIFVCESNEARLNHVKKTYGVNGGGDVKDITDFARVIFIGVKPPDVKGVCASIKNAARNAIRDSGGRRDHIIISMAADVSLAQLEEYLDADTPIMRIMSNLNAAIGRAVTAYAVNAPLAQLYSHDELLRGFSFLEATGQAYELEESKFHIFTKHFGKSNFEIKVNFNKIFLISFID
jgi:pyrroline-5-carboxylate reductase